MIYEISDTSKVVSLFGNWQETLIWSCLQGIMGKIYADDAGKPTAAMAVLGDFAFFAGKPNRELAAYKPAWCTQSFMILVPRDEPWERLITQVYGERAKVVPRYAIRKEGNIFDKERLKKAAASLPEGYTLSMIDERLYHMCRAEAWSADLVSQFASYEMYQALGLGVVLRKGNLIVSGASSYSRYREGIEIEIDTREDYRRKGFAYACGAKLILACLEKDLYPSWDAQNKASVALAEKLGYHYSHTYTAIEVRNY